LAFEVQELPDIIRIVVLLTLAKGSSMEKRVLKTRIDKYCAGQVCIEVEDVNRTLKEMSNEKLIEDEGEKVRLTEKGQELGREWQNLLLKREPILEVVAGLTDGSITSLVVVLSALVASISTKVVVFAAILTLTAVAITNFSSFLLGGKTEDIADLLTLRKLMDYSLSDISDEIERDKSLYLVKHLFAILHKEINKANLYAATICGTTTFMAGIVPIIAYLMLPPPINLILSLGIVGCTVGVFLVRYRSERSKVHWRITLAETVIIIAIATVASLIIGSI